MEYNLVYPIFSGSVRLYYGNDNGNASEIFKFASTVVTNRKILNIDSSKFLLFTKVYSRTTYNYFCNKPD